ALSSRNIESCSARAASRLPFHAISTRRPISAKVPAYGTTSTGRPQLNTISSGRNPMPPVSPASGLGWPTTTRSYSAASATALPVSSASRKIHSPRSLPVERRFAAYQDPSLGAHGAEQRRLAGRRAVAQGERPRQHELRYVTERHKRPARDRMPADIFELVTRCRLADDIAAVGHK